MLESLLGSKNIAMILTFLFIHKTCYGAQVQRFFKTALAPIQKALFRLEEMGVLESAFHGKSRIYMFNRTYPLYQELYDLIKKAYTCLPPEEKKRYFLAYHESGLEYGAADQALLEAWQTLQKIRFLTFTSTSHGKTETGRNGHAVGEVTVSKNGSNKGETRLIFLEKGIWHGSVGVQIDFSNTFRWTLDRSAGTISLEHLRHGEEHPVFLFHLRPIGKQAFLSQDAHLCGNDAYFGKAIFSRFGLQLTWKVIGPMKNEEIEYRYTF